MIQELDRLIQRDLAVLERELALYPDDASLWTVLPGLATPGGNLAQHLVGNLRHFIGATLGGTGYIRHREAEFSDRTATRAELVDAVRQTARDVTGALATLDPARLGDPFPLEVGGGRPVTGLFLMHLLTHLGFHLGQIDYHRRVVSGDPVSAGPTPVSDLLGDPS